MRMCYVAPVRWQLRRVTWIGRRRVLFLYLIRAHINGLGVLVQPLSHIIGAGATAVIAALIDHKFLAQDSLSDSFRLMEGCNVVHLLRLVLHRTLSRSKISYIVWVQSLSVRVGHGAHFFKVSKVICRIFSTKIGSLNDFLRLCNRGSLWRRCNFTSLIELSFRLHSGEISAIGSYWGESTHRVLQISTLLLLSLILHNLLKHHILLEFFLSPYLLFQHHFLLGHGENLLANDSHLIDIDTFFHLHKGILHCFETARSLR